MDIYQIQELLSQRYPFIFIDKVIHITDGDEKRIVGIKNVSINEPYFQGHFPETPIFPSSLILEAMQQNSLLLFLKNPEYTGRLGHFHSIKKCEFVKQVIPGDQLRLECEVKAINDNRIDIVGIALVDGTTVCTAEFSFQLQEKPSRTQIHPTASVHASAILGKDVIVGPYTIIGENVVIGDGTVLESNINIERWTRIGENCHIHFGAVIGSAAQDLKYSGEKTWVVIGNNNIIREYVTINRSTGADTVTEVGNNNLLLTNVHIAHNCKLGNNIVIANMTNLAGHTTVENNVIIGGMTGIHQFTRIGEGCMVGAYTRLTQDIPPFMLCEGNPALIRGLNLIGLRRRGVSRSAIKEIKDIYKSLYRSSQNTGQALKEIENLSLSSSEAEHLRTFVCTDSPRGITKKSKHEDLDD